MRVVVCISNGGGMMFNKRRQSRDAELIENLSLLVGDGTVYTNDFSAPLFEGSSLSVLSVSSPLECAGEDDTVFAENISLKEKKDKISSLVIYKWNRRYPSDKYLDVSPEELGMRLADTLDFAGKSHEKITRETWNR